ncbi:MAG: RdgB/HAM1 family non-canonical purine NTP pyrophosphatase [Gammaproteobacteria bacterium]|nr:RdgB/HAM1 family non-canonical purine NTP pyrophosphatase [Gammaproteobacteria bacterium]
MTLRTRPPKVVMASSNPGKLREINQILGELGMEVIPQSEFDVPDADETGLSFVENSILKARHASQLTGLPAIADDSGLEVDALKGAPGIYSARYFSRTNSSRSGGTETGTTDEKNLQKLLQDLKDVPEAERTARFQCLMVYMSHAEDPTPLICQGTWEGRILFEPQGEGGFGYDPIFYVPGEDCASAELAPEVKNRLSHRGQALAKLVEALSQSVSA